MNLVWFDSVFHIFFPFFKYLPASNRLCPWSDNIAPSHDFSTLNISCLPIIQVKFSFQSGQGLLGQVYPILVLVLKL